MTSITTRASSEKAAVRERTVVRCEACGGDVVPKRESPWWWLAVVGTYALVLGMAPIAVIFPLCFVGIPVMLGIGMPLIAYTSDKVHRPAECPSCGRYLE
jgi:hypothetical protein